MRRFDVVSNPTRLVYTPTGQCVEYSEVEPLLKELEALRTYAHEATKAITGLTSGGSEFFDKKINNMYTADLDFCVKRIRHTRESMFGELKDTIIERNRLRDENKDLRDKITELQTFVFECGQNAITASQTEDRNNG